ncbi:response regulator [Anaerolineae bacterium CFX9]|nr:response regulator [Anaerolineae bacterium CFX9]
MAKRFNYNAIIDDERAEGVFPSGEPTDRLGQTQPELLSGVADVGAPIAETGTVQKISVQSEGFDSADRQDAVRTTAETLSYHSQPHGEDLEMTASPSVLIIEDTPDLAELLEATLRRMNLRAISESHGARGFARYEEMKPDVVFLDISLPDISGWKVLDNIKENHRDAGGKLPAVIVITALGDPANRVVGKLQGVHSYLVKPFTTDDVERAVSSALSSVIS